MSAAAIQETDFFEVTMNAVVIYRERDSASKANALLKRACERADAGTQWTIKPWRLDLLKWAPLAQEALRDAAEAHLLILAVRSEPELLPRLLDWLEAWAVCRQVQGAALALFDDGTDETLSATATSAISEFAERQGLSLIVGEVTAWKDESSRILEDLHERAVAQTPTMVHILKQETPRKDRDWVHQ